MDFQPFHELRPVRFNGFHTKIETLRDLFGRTSSALN
jgi:hypothetical protein